MNRYRITVAFTHKDGTKGAAVWVTSALTFTAAQARANGWASELTAIGWTPYNVLVAQVRT